MNQFDQFQYALSLTKVSENIFAFTPDSRYFVGNTPHGGYLMAIMNKALSSVMPHPSAINSNIYYLDNLIAEKKFELVKANEKEKIKLPEVSSENISDGKTLKSKLKM